MAGAAFGDLAIATCDRCKAKVKYKELRPDGNSPGLKVCRSCCDTKDPYRLPARQPETITLQTPRPDSSVTSEVSYLTDTDGSYIMTSDGDYIEV